MATLISGRDDRGDAAKAGGYASRMREGALAMFDALGFRGIWNRGATKGRADDVLQKLRSLRDTANATIDSYTNELRASVPPELVPNVTASFLSDTIVVAADLPNAPPTVDRPSVCLVTVARLVAAVLQQAAVPPVPLVYRGCISYGEFEIDREFIVGRAVDLAADAHNAADVAAVWLLPQAAELLAQTSPRVPWDVALTQTTVPLKGGTLFATRVVNPFNRFPREQRVQLRDNILSAFDDHRLEVQIKKQHTAQILHTLRHFIDGREHEEEAAAREKARQLGSVTPEEARRRLDAERPAK